MGEWLAVCDDTTEPATLYSSPRLTMSEFDAESHKIVETLRELTLLRSTHQPAPLPPSPSQHPTRASRLCLASPALYN